LWPLVKSGRKCTPAKIRLSVASSPAAEKLSKERSTPGRTSEVTLKSKWFSRKKEIRIDAPAALIMACAPGYEGSGVVLPTPGSQFGSGTVFGLPLVAASRIAVTGDRKSTRLNSSHVAISYAVFCLKKKIQG